MKKFVARVERAVLKVVLAPELRPIEDAAASKLARSLLVRFGASTVVSAAVLDVIAHFLG